MSNTFYSIVFLKDAYKVEQYVESGLTANYDLVYPKNAPANNNVLKWNTTKSAFEWVDASAFGTGGTVTSVALSMPSIFAVTGSPITTNGTLTVSLSSQTANTVFSSPNGSAGSPTFRKLVDADITDFSAAKLTNTAPKSVIPGGTTATSFQLNGNSGASIKDEPTGTGITIYNSGGTVGNFLCRNLTVLENIDTQSSTTVNLGDAILNLNANFTTGTPTTNCGLNVRRGSSTDSGLIWDENLDAWQAGVNDNLLTLARRAEVVITNADLTSGLYTFTHNLRVIPGKIQVINNSNREIGVSITHTTVNACSIDFTKVGTLTGNWRIVATG